MQSSRRCHRFPSYHHHYHSRIFRDKITNFSINEVTANVFDEPNKLANFAATVSPGEVQELEDALESFVVDNSLPKALSAPLLFLFLSSN
jgi:hypothetical protein